MNVAIATYTALLERREYLRQEIGRMECGYLREYPMYGAYVQEKRLIDEEVRYRDNVGVLPEQKSVEGLPLFS